MVYLHELTTPPMVSCIICETEFDVPKSKIKREKQYHSTDPNTNEEYYMCSDCEDERATAEYRYLEGVILCSNMGCGRNAMAFSKQCEICNNKLT